MVRWNASSAAGQGSCSNRIYWVPPLNAISVRSQSASSIWWIKVTALSLPSTCGSASSTGL